MRTVTLALVFLMLGVIREVTTTHGSVPQLIGETVTVSYVADPSIGHGRFRLDNPGDVAVMVAVKSAWLELGGHRQPLTGVSIFDLGRDQMMNPESFKIDAAATVTILVGFPEVAHQPRFGESGAVGLQLSVNGAEVQALSAIKFERRIPFGH